MLQGKKVTAFNQDYNAILDQKIEILQSNVDEWNHDTQTETHFIEFDPAEVYEQKQINEANLKLIETIVKLQARRKSNNSSLKEISEYVTDYIGAMLKFKTEIVSDGSTVIMKEKHKMTEITKILKEMTIEK